MGVVDQTPQRGLGPYLSRLAAEWDLDAPGRRWQSFDATLVFVDISGFTALSERLAARGRIGAEELTDVLNDVFGAMLARAYERDGRLLKFGGDALLLLYRGDVVDACESAVELRATLADRVRTIRTSAGRLRLRMSVGVHRDRIHVVRAGDTDLELVVAGPAATTTTQMEHAAEAGEILVSPVVAAELPLRRRGPPKGPGVLLRGRSSSRPALGPMPTRRVDAGTIARWIPEPLREHLAAGPAEPEHRMASIAFIRAEGTDGVLASAGADAFAGAIDRTVRIVQDAARSEGLMLLATDIDADALKLIVVGGAPSARHDDAGAVLRAMRHVLTAEPPLSLRIGVHRGHVYAGEVGMPFRRTYTIIGDSVNLAARLMAAAPTGQIYATAAALDQARTLFATSAIEPFAVKGKADLVQAHDVGPELGPRADAPGVLPLTGRDEEIGQLRRALADAGAGHGSVVEIVGEIGAGKTRLIEELRAGAAVASLVIRGDPYAATVPYRAWRDTLRDVLDLHADDGAPELQAALGALDGDLERVAPLLGPVLSITVADNAETAVLEPRFRPARTADAVLALLDHAYPGVALIVVEDAHWIDDVSTEVLDRVTRGATERRWLVCVTRRDEPQGFRPDGAAVLRLTPLDAPSARRLVLSATMAAPLRPHEVDALLARASGSPLLIEELLGVLRTSGRADDLPASLDALAMAEIDTLPPLARRLVRHASVLGRRFRRELLDAVLGDLLDTLDDGTREAVAAVLVPAADDTLRFRHAVLCDSAYEGLSYGRRREIHGRVAAALERLHPDGAVEEAATLALHWSRAGDHERTWRYGVEGGDHARAAYANIEAAASYELALAAATHVRVARQAVRDAWTALGDVRERAGLFDGAVEAYGRALRGADGDEVERAALLMRRARVFERRGQYGRALRDARRGVMAVAASSSPDADRARARLAAFRAVVYEAMGRPHHARRLAEQAVTEAERASDASALARAYTVLDWANITLGVQGFVRWAPKALALYEELDDLSGQAGVLNNLGAEAYFAGQWDEAVHLYERSRELFLRTGNDVQATTGAINIAEVLMQQGRYADAEPLLEDALRVCRSTGFRDGEAYAMLYFARLLVARGDRRAGEAELRRAVDAFAAIDASTSVAEARLHLAESLALSDDTETALTIADEVERSAAGRLLQVALARVRTIAMAQRGRAADLAAVIDGGLAEARAHGLLYDVVFFLAARDELDRRTGVGPDPAREREAADIAASLGLRVWPRLDELAWSDA